MTTLIINPEAIAVADWRFDPDRQDRSVQVAFYTYEPDSPDAFPEVAERWIINLDRQQATHLMARLAALIDDSDITTYYGTRATVTVNLDNDGMEGS